jgi:hypothetical protein
MLDFNKIVLLSFALFSVVVGFDLAAIKPRFPQQFTGQQLVSHRQ